MFEPEEFYKHDTMVDVAMYVTSVGYTEHNTYIVICDWYNTTYKHFIGVEGRYEISFEEAKRYRKVNPK